MKELIFKGTATGASNERRYVLINYWDNIPQLEICTEVQAQRTRTGPSVVLRDEELASFVTWLKDSGLVKQENS